MVVAVDTRVLHVSTLEVVGGYPLSVGVLGAASGPWVEEVIDALKCSSTLALAFGPFIINLVLELNIRESVEYLVVADRVADHIGAGPIGVPVPLSMHQAVIY